MMMAMHEAMMVYTMAYCEEWRGEERRGEE